MYEDQTDVIIKSRMTNDITSNVNTYEGTFIYDVLSPVSKEFAQFYIKLDQLRKRVFAITAAENGYSKDLELRAAELGVYRKDGTAATGIVTFNGNDGVVILKDTLVQTVGGLKFKTTEEKIISNGSVNVSIVAIELGKKYNVPSNIIVQLPVQITGVISMSNLLPTTGGTEKETDEAMLSRLLLKAQAPAISGNPNHYKIWATEVNGIGDAKVFPLWAGPGTVKVCIIDSNKQPANLTLVNAVIKHIDDNKPIGALVTVVPAKTLKIDINVKIVRNNNYSLDEIKNNIADTISEYLKSIAFKQDYLSFAKIGSYLLSTKGIADYSNLLINGSDSNVLIGSDQVTILGGITLNE